jgi:predicted cupin superfamily sugar epimerase
MTADEVKRVLGLAPHPREGGWFVQTYGASEMVSLERYSGARRTSTAIYYLLESTTFSEMHRLESDEVFHFYAGDAVEMLQLAEGAGTHSGGRVVLLGNDLAAGQSPQVVVERGVWQGSRLRAGGAWALLGCTVSPGFEYEDYETGGRAELVEKWPEFAEMIGSLTRG